MAYATLAQLKAYLNQITDDSQDALLEDVLDRATAIIDTVVGYSFAPAASGERVVYGNGTDYLIPPQFVAGTVESVATITGYTVPDYIEQAGALVVTRESLTGAAYHSQSLSGAPYGLTGGWLAGVPYTVTADFGVAATVPLDIQECCLQLAVRIWRAKDAGFSDVVGVEGSGDVGYNGALPALVKKILTTYATSSPGVW
jgi:hypothetical protein